MRGGRWVLTAFLLLGVGTAGPLQAGTTDVACSDSALQSAVSAASRTAEDDVLRLAAPCVYSLSATLTVPAAGGVLTLRGGSGTVLDGGDALRLLRVEDGASAVVEKLVLRNARGPVDGNQTRGGAIRSTGTLRVADSSFMGNDGGRVGGAIDSTIGSLTVVRSLFFNNRSENGGAIYAEGTLTVVSSTFVANTSPIGSAILSFSSGTVSSSSIVANQGQALHQDTKSLAVVNTVLSRNPRNCAITGGGRLDDLGGNLEDQAGTCGWNASTSSESADPVLLPFADNGGFTKTFAPGPGSPLLDRGARCSDGGPAVFDQRLRRRPATGCDIGAMESESAGALSGNGDFGTANNGPVRRTYLLRSGGADPLVVGSASVTGSGFSLAEDRCAGRTLPAGQACAVIVAFSPTASGPSQGLLRVVDNGDAAPRSIVLTGTRSAAVPPPAPSPSAVLPPGGSPSPAAASAPATGQPTPTPTPAPISSDAPDLTAAPAELVEAPRRVELGDGQSQLVSTQRAGFPQAVPLPTQVSLELEDLARSAWLAALLLLLLGLPVGLVNDTLGAHREELAHRMSAVRQRLGRLRPPEKLYAGLRLRVAAPMAALVSAFVYGFLDPSFGWNRESAASVVGLVVTVVLTGLVGRQSKLFFLRRTYDIRASLRLLPGFIGLAIACTLLSRISGLQPGLVLGSVLGVQMSRGLRWREEGQAVAVSCAALATASIVAWFTWVPIARAAAGPTPSFIVLVLDVVLAATFVIGVEALAFGLVPLRFLDGQALWRWSKRAWLGLASLGMFGFVHVVVHPTDGVEAFVGRERYLSILLGTYVVGALTFWSYFRFRAAGGSTEQLSAVRR